MKEDSGEFVFGCKPSFDAAAARKNGMIPYTLLALLGQPEDRVTYVMLRDIEHGFVLSDMIEIDDEGDPCVPIVEKNFFMPFNTELLFLAHYPSSYLPLDLRRDEWEGIFPDGPAFDTLRPGDRVTIAYWYDPSPGNTETYNYEIQSIKHEPLSRLVPKPYDL